MSSRSSTALVIVVAAITGVVLARGAGGASAQRSATAKAAPFVAAQASAAGTAVSARDEGEPDEPRAAPGDNPYEESPPSRATLLHQPVVAQGGMLRLAGGG